MLALTALGRLHRKFVNVNNIPAYCCSDSYLFVTLLIVWFRFLLGICVSLSLFMSYLFSRFLMFVFCSRSPFTPLTFIEPPSVSVRCIVPAQDRVPILPPSVPTPVPCHWGFEQGERFPSLGGRNIWAGRLPLWLIFYVYYNGFGQVFFSLPVKICHSLLAKKMCHPNPDITHKTLLPLYLEKSIISIFLCGKSGSRRIVSIKLHVFV